jgi:YkoY family integral membrane protein
MNDFFIQYFNEDASTSLLIILNLFLIESLLSVDNAAVLATMVMDLPSKLRNKALQYGILGAYFFRGVCLLFASYMVKFLWLKALGGFYLMYITYNHFFSKEHKEDTPAFLKRENWLYKLTKGAIGIFWSTVILVEVMDLTFSIDNIFAAVAITDNIYLICIGVFIGILAMRFVAQSFVKLMETYSFLENTAFFVIGILGLKLLVSSVVDYFGTKELAELINGHKADLIFSIITASFFFVPLLTSTLFNFPKRAKPEIS